MVIFQNNLILTCLALFLSLRLGSKQACASTQDVIESIRSQSLFFETFDDDDWQSRWKHSADPKYTGRFTTDTGHGWTNKGLKIPEQNKYYGLTAVLAAPVDPVVSSGLMLVVQYEVRYGAGITCGGSYIKLLSAQDEGQTPEGLVDSTPYSIMFGPDRCGGPGKVHLILRHRHRITGNVTEHHLAAPPVPEADGTTHVYTLRLFPDQRYEVLVDGVVKSSGDLAAPATLQPPLLPPRELPDPGDVKPADWVDLEKIPDPHAVKPADWDDREKVEDERAVKPKGWLEDEPELIDDPAAKQPADWDEEEDGLWEPNQIRNPRCKKVGCGPWRRPLVPNPAYQGPWEPPLIDNPDYKGPWIQRTLPNPDFYEDTEPVRHAVAPLAAVALELWTVDSGYLFDNILITRDPQAAERAVGELWRPRHEAETKLLEEQARAREQEEQERKKKAAEEEKKKKGGRRGKEQLERVAEAVLDLFEDGRPLAPLAPLLSTPLAYLRTQPESALLLVAAAPLAALALVLVGRFLAWRKESKATEGATAEDDSPPDAAAAGTEDDATDPGAAAEEEQPETGGITTAVAEAATEAEQPETGPAAGGQAATGKEAGEGGAGPQAPVNEITADKDDDEEDEEDEKVPTGARRRVRRAA